MGKHKTDRKSPHANQLHNRVGQTPQAPKAGGNQQNQYR